MESGKSVVVFDHNGVVITSDERDTLVKSITTQNPTEAELKLYFYDCARRGVHPLDKLIYFTKRKGRYTPVTGIDYMRIRAESSGAYAGSDDAVFNSPASGKYPMSATVTVWKMVSGQRCSFSATARWSEYSPEDISDSSAFMWRKMPHNMLAKCAEALALRKAFPGQLSGLYTREEFDQAGPVDGYAVEKHDAPRITELPGATTSEITDSTTDVVASRIEPSRTPSPEETVMVTLAGRSMIKNAKETISAKAAQSFMESYVGDGKKFHLSHLKNHLRTHFHVDALGEMTWKKLAALVSHAEDKGDDPEYYGAGNTTPKSPDENTDLYSRIEGLGMSVEGLEETLGKSLIDLSSGELGRVGTVLSLAQQGKIANSPESIKEAWEMG